MSSQTYHLKITNPDLVELTELMIECHQIALSHEKPLYAKWVTRFSNVLINRAAKDGDIEMIGTYTRLLQYELISKMPVEPVEPPKPAKPPVDPEVDRAEKEQMWRNIGLDEDEIREVLESYGT